MNNHTINAIYKRDLDKVFFSLSIISQDIFFNDGDDYVKKRTVDIIIGTTINGTRRYIASIFDDEFQKTSSWYEFLLSLKNRGLEHIFFVSMPYNQVIKKAFDLAFSNIYFFYSCFDVIKKINHYVNCSYSNNIFRALSYVFNSESIDEFNIKKDELFSNYSYTPFIVDILDNELKYFYDYLNFPTNIRKHIISIHFNEKFIRFLNSSANSKPFFSSLNEFEELILPRIQIIELKMYCGKEEWNSVISYLYNDNKELLLCVL